MKILVNDLAASASGALTVLKSFYSYAKNDDADNEYIFLISGPYLEETERIKIEIIQKVKKSGFHKLYFDLISGKKVIEKYNPDYVISLQNIITFGYKGKQGVFVHQAIPFQKTKKFSFFKSDERTYAFYQYIVGYFIKKSIKKADSVFVQTQWMRKAIIDICRIPQDGIFVVPSSCPVGNKYLYHPDNRLFFYPAAFENVYKNQSCLYKAAEMLIYKGYRNFNVELTLETQHSPHGGCKFIGLLDKEEMFQHYSRSILVFPSFVEAGSLPLVEAKSAGAIIFSADCEYSRDILNGYANAYYFDPFRPETLAALMERSIKGEIEYKTQNIQSDTSETASGWESMINKIRI